MSFPSLQYILTSLLFFFLFVFLFEPVRVSHPIAHSLQLLIEQLPTVERAFIHVDCQTCSTGDRHQRNKGESNRSPLPYTGLSPLPIAEWEKNMNMNTYVGSAK